MYGMPHCETAYLPLCLAFLFIPPLFFLPKSTLLSVALFSSVYQVMGN